MSIPSSPPGPEEPFGSRLLDEIRAIGGDSVISSRLDHDAIRRLERADREGAARAFFPDCFEVEQVILERSPKESAEAIVEEARRRAGAEERFSPFGFVLEILSLWF